jgi:hypothetical protein
MSSQLQDLVKIMAEVTRPCWDWYTREVTTTKTPIHAVKYCIRLCGDRWMSERHLLEMVRILSDQQRLDSMGIEAYPAVRGLAGSKDR